MNDLSTDGPANGSDLARALAEIERDFPAWQCWAAVIPGVIYARRLKSSPPRVLRSIDVTDLRAQVCRAERMLRSRLGE